MMAETYRELPGNRAVWNTSHEPTRGTTHEALRDTPRKTSIGTPRRITPRDHNIKQTTSQETSGPSRGTSSERTRTHVPKPGESMQDSPLSMHGTISGQRSRGAMRARPRDSVQDASRGTTYRGPYPDVALPTWTLVSPQGPALSHHVGAVIRNRFYVHGGVDKKGSTKPLGKLFVMDMLSGLWSEVHAARCPALSHHAGLAIENRYLVLVGGWNGHKRCTDVFAYDVQEECWLVMDTSGFPVNSGLSSHAVIQIDSGDLLVVGREGSTRIQRRMSNVYLLRGSVLRNRFVYEEQSLEPASRSGHTMHFVSGNLLCIIGGRADELIEGHRGYRSKGSTHAAGILGRLREVCQDKLKPATGVKIPKGRRHHVSVAGAGSIFVHGGETFDGKNREPVGEMILIVTRPELQWYHLGTTAEGRAGHVCVQFEDDIYIHGGEGSKGVVYGATYRLCM